ncbi:hypothetical protein [Bosea sp. AS-1]|uniref:hypothetical protein n=1 Tax=Bosea sp. AS-1 TaxID=2015316 RepID=UPI000B7926C9|nr:hypothetical protein [Bosea sp. AS-1]
MTMRIMRRTLIAAASALALAAGSVGASSPASAHPAALIPLAIAAGVGGVGLGAVAASAAPRGTTVVVPERQEYQSYYGPSAPAVVDQAPCYWTRAAINGVMRRVQVCD